jgi:glycosyltransferase involved in cell wall biosynthesis
MIATVCLLLSAVIAFGVWFKLRRVFRQSRMTTIMSEARTENDLPSVSLCIPARNEVHAMTDCLESALRSSYPKLEIIVLDDGSRDDTLNLIKSFAHAGVRFVEGTPLPEGWLGKNHALEGLAHEASGSLLLFADVDTRFTPDSIEQLVAYMMHESADMVSVLPTRYDGMRPSAIFATMRHFWNLLGHNAKHPAVASSAWMIKRSLLVDTLNGFNNVASAVRPEKSIAATVAQTGAYRFVISTAQLGVSYEKRLSSQFETAVRIYYPDFGFSGILVRLAGLLLCFTPYVLFVSSLLAGDYVNMVISIICIVILSTVNAWYLSVLRSNNYGIASLCLPYILIREMYLLMLSFDTYKRKAVTWKGRSVQVSTKKS